MGSVRSALALTVLAAAACSHPDSRAGAGATPAADPARPLPSPLPEIVARVDGRAILLQQVLPLAKTMLERVPQQERDKKLPEVLRSSVEKYVERELLLGEALRQGVSARSEDVEWAYDQMRREHPDEAAWGAFLQKLGTDPQSLRAELRIQRTVAALIDREAQKLQVSEPELRAFYDAEPGRFAAPGGAVPPFESVRERVAEEVRRERSPQVAAELVARLRAQARIEILL
jgi:hypothetical protein